DRALAAHREPGDGVPAPARSHSEAPLDQRDELLEVIALPTRTARAPAPPVRIPALVALRHHDDRGEALRDVRDVALLRVHPRVVGVAVTVQQVQDREAPLAVVAVGEQYVDAQGWRAVGGARRLVERDLRWVHVAT